MIFVVYTFHICNKYIHSLLCSLLQLNYKEKYEKEKFKCYLPPDYPFFIQSRVNAFNISDVSFYSLKFLKCLL